MVEKTQADYYLEAREAWESTREQISTFRGYRTLGSMIIRAASGEDEAMVVYYNSILDSWIAGREESAATQWLVVEITKFLLDGGDPQSDYVQSRKEKIEVASGIALSGPPPKPRENVEAKLVDLMEGGPGTDEEKADLAMNFDQFIFRLYDELAAQYRENVEPDQ